MACGAEQGVTAFFSLVHLIAFSVTPLKNGRSY